ncbi:MAG: hypothetical protein QNK05_25425 [Myxococcota bacterium]|nr:hypothetical protein [Myxococcota bacterium]
MSSLRRQIEYVADEMRRMEGVRVRVPERAMSDLALASVEDQESLLDAADVGRAIREALPHMDFDAESGDATTMAELVEETRPALEAEATRSDRRRLQARVESELGDALDPQGPVPRGNRYRLGVRIAQELETHGIGLPVDFPAPPPTEDGQPHRLSVLFWEKTLSPEPQVQTLLLPPRADSEYCYFPFRAPDEPVQIAARIAVFHRNRNLQTGVLRGWIGTDDAGLSFKLDAAPFPRFSGLAGRQGIGASLIFNDDDAGFPRVFPFANGRAGHVDLSVDPNMMKDFKDALGEDIAAITAQADRFEGLRAEGSVELLVKMARRGGNLMRMLKQFTVLGGELDHAEHVQVVCARAGAFFPAEYLYDGQIPAAETSLQPGDPEDTRVTRLCGGVPGDAEAALENGECCGAYGADPRHTVCPLRFWSLSKVIERHAFEPDHAALPDDFQLRAGPPTQRAHTLTPLKAGLLAASDIANRRVPTTVATLKARVEAVVDRTPLQVPGDWAGWEQAIRRERPSLLVLLPHHGRHGSSDYLEIGAGARESFIVDSYVQAPGHTDTRPVVLLIGCETSDASVAFEGFVPQFQVSGAAIVVTTIASILGRQAGPVAGELVEQMAAAAQQGNVPFGQIMRDVRRKLLAGGTPMVLGLTSYGDADWLVAS